MSRQMMIVGALLASPLTAAAAEICGNGQDDDANGLADEGCAALTCDSPLSCGDTGLVSPSMGALQYALPPDVAPRVPYGPSISLARYYLSMYAPGGGAPAYRKPMGERWGHTYTTWLDKHTAPDPDHNVSSAFDARNRRVFKQFHDETTLQKAQWFFYYDALDRLTEIRHTPDTSSPGTYTVFQLFWLGNRLVLYWQTDYPSVTTSKRYVGTDETGRPIDMWCWGVGNCPRVWSIDPSAWGMDTNLMGPGVFQPILFAGQYQDPETTAWQNDGGTVHRPGVVLNGFRTYDPFVGSYLQVDPLLSETWSSYVYVESNPVGKRDPLGLEITTQSVACQYNSLQGGYMPDEDSGLGDPRNYSLGECEGAPDPAPEGTANEGADPAGNPGGLEDIPVQCNHLVMAMNRECANAPHGCPGATAAKPVSARALLGSPPFEVISATHISMFDVWFMTVDVGRPPPPISSCPDPDHVVCRFTHTCAKPSECSRIEESCDKCLEARSELEACIILNK